MDDEMELKEGKSIMGGFLSSLVVSAIIIFLAYYFSNFDVAVLVGLCLIIATIVSIGVGIQNILVTGVRNQTIRLRGNLKGYLTDMYAEMIKDKGN